MKVIGPDGFQSSITQEEADKRISLTHFAEDGQWKVKLVLTTGEDEESALNIIKMFDQLLPIMTVNFGAPNV